MHNDGIWYSMKCIKWLDNCVVSWLYSIKHVILEDNLSKLLLLDIVHKNQIEKM